MKIQASFEYLQRLDIYNRQKPYEIFVPLERLSNPAIPRTNLQFEAKTALVQDARGREDEFTLDNHGFAFRTHETQALGPQPPSGERIESEYVQEVQDLIRTCIPGIVRMCTFDWRVRKSMNRDEFAKRTVDLEDGLDPLLPAVHPHVDQSAAGALKRVQRHMGEEAAELLKGRFQIINVWRPLHIVTSWPLAMCDAQSVKPDDLVPTDIIRKRFVGETCFALHNTDHKWYYLSRQRTDEVTIFKIYDSKPGVRAKYCLHSSFRGDLGEIEEARESIEVRTLVFTGS